MVVDDDGGPLGPWQLHGAGADGAVGGHDAAGAEPTEHVGPGVSGVGQDAAGPGVGQPSPAQLAGPGPAVGALGEPTLGECPDNLVGRAGGLEGGEHVSHRGVDLLVGSITVAPSSS